LEEVADLEPAENLSKGLGEIPALCAIFATQNF
jgi:hypothetical protein